MGYRPCCAQPGPAFLLNPHELVGILTLAPPLQQTRLTYEGSTQCLTCKKAYHTFREIETHTPTARHASVRVVTEYNVY